ncbi:MAG: hypothetical protein K6F51_05420 [Acetatifactor sp.]|nr:hypothetical protein [Acetatifactor sp.]
MNAFVLFREYMGTGLLLLWYVISLCYLFFAEKRKDRRITFLYVPLILLLLFFNPLFFSLFQKVLGEEIFYRMLWLLPVTVTLAYAVVKVCSQLKGKTRVTFGCAAVILTIISGSFVYDSPYFSWARNVDHVPREVAEICDLIEIPGMEVMAVFPPEMLHFVRQYTARVCMPYGREVLLNEFNELEYVTHYKKVDVAKLAGLAKKENCHYVILSEEKELSESMESYDYQLIGHVGKYLVYQDPTRDYFRREE